MMFCNFWKTHPVTKDAHPESHRNQFGVDTGAWPVPLSRGVLPIPDCSLPAESILGFGTRDYKLVFQEGYNRSSPDEFGKYAVLHVPTGRLLTWQEVGGLQLDAPTVGARAALLRPPTCTLLTPCPQSSLTHDYPNRPARMVQLRPEQGAAAIAPLWMCD